MQSNKISAMILAAGFGKRLENITQNVPKPLVKISGKTLIQSSLELLNYLNINDIIVEAQKKKIKTIGELDNIVKIALRSSEKTILIAIYNNQNQRRYIGVKLD